MSVAQATVTQTVSHVPVKPKYGFPEPIPNMLSVYVVIAIKGELKRAGHYMRASGSQECLSYFNEAEGP